MLHLGGRVAQLKQCQEAGTYEKTERLLFDFFLLAASMAVGVYGLMLARCTFFPEVESHSAAIAKEPVGALDLLHSYSSSKSSRDLG